jgi:hypothetical protein
LRLKDVDLAVWLNLQVAQFIYFLWRNEKFGLPKNSGNFVNMRVFEGFFKMDCKKAPRSVQVVKV